MPLFRLLLGLFLLSTLTHCKNDDSTTPTPTAASQTALLIGNNWQTSSVTTTDGQIINPSRLNIFTQALYKLTMQFRDNGTVRAFDPNQSNSVVNAGTWKLKSDNESMDVDVSGFSGNFPIIQLTKSKLILRQQAPVDGKTTDINLVFDPVL